MDYTLVLCGDVMTGRGIDQILPHPSKPRIYEACMDSAAGYVEIAEAASGPIPKPAEFGYIWGEAMAHMQLAQVRIINLETAVTTAEDAWVGKGIHYRMHPANLPCLSAAGIDGCALANNHVLDWGYAGLEETLDTLHAAGIETAGAGRRQEEAAAPAVIQLPAGGRVLLFGYGMQSAGVSPEWAASADRPGVNLLADLSTSTAEDIAQSVAKVKRAGDIVVASIHWGSNWGYQIPPAQRAFAHCLIETGVVDAVHGHSSHHPKGIEVYRHKPILYGCGDFLNDYEGIRGYESFRPDLSLMYLPTVDFASGRLVRLVLIPLQIRRFRLNRVSESDLRWLQHTLDREGRALGTRLEREPDDTLAVLWT